MKERFNETRVVTRDFFQDWLQSIRSLFGMRQKAYEKRIDDTLKNIFDELDKKGNIDWYRINQDVIGDAIIITVYGELNTKDISRILK